MEIYHSKKETDTFTHIMGFCKALHFWLTFRSLVNDCTVENELLYFSWSVSVWYMKCWLHISEDWFNSWLLCFKIGLLLICLGRQHIMVQVTDMVEQDKVVGSWLHPTYFGLLQWISDWGISICLPLYCFVFEISILKRVIDLEFERQDLQKGAETECVLSAGSLSKWPWWS